MKLSKRAQTPAVAPMQQQMTQQQVVRESKKQEIVKDINELINKVTYIFRDPNTSVQQKTQMVANLVRENIINISKKVDEAAGIKTVTVAPAADDGEIKVPEFWRKNLDYGER